MITEPTQAITSDTQSWPGAWDDPPSVTHLVLGDVWQNGNLDNRPFFGAFHSLWIYDAAVSDADLKALFAVDSNYDSCGFYLAYYNTIVSHQLTSSDVTPPFTLNNNDGSDSNADGVDSDDGESIDINGAKAGKS